MERFNTALPYIYIDNAEDVEIDGSKILSIIKIDDLEQNQNYTYFEVKCEKKFRTGSNFDFLLEDGQIIIVKFDEKDYICCCKDHIDTNEESEDGYEIMQVKAIPIFFNESIVTAYETNINDLNDALKNKLDELSNLIGTNVESQVVSDE